MGPAWSRPEPARVAGIVLAGSLPIGVRVPWPLSAVHGRIAPAPQRGWPERHLERMVPPFMSKRDDVRCYVEQAIAPLGRGDLATCTRTAAEALGRRDPGGVPEAPTLCVSGDAGIGFVARRTRSWAQRSALARFVVLEGAGHLVIQAASAAFSEAVAAFVQGLEGFNSCRCMSLNL